MTVIQQAEERLRRLILDMEIGPGERLTERWLEGQTGASRSSIRTALVRLEAEGLVAREGRGWLVPPIDLQEIEQLFVYREMLEVTAVRLGGKEAEESYLSDREEPNQRGPAGRGSSWPCRCAPADLVHLKYCDPGWGQ